MYPETREAGLFRAGKITKARACQRKSAYLTKAEARKEANRVERRERRDRPEHALRLHTYHCPFCQMYHIAKTET